MELKNFHGYVIVIIMKKEQGLLFSKLLTYRWTVKGKTKLDSFKKK